ncbi:hypothetical protein [Flavobacterium sp.]|uniref:hypothetical protein n=1 Tax=Flavobacterium sp. TaxID=239 RepID=UPI0032641700
MNRIDFNQSVGFPFDTNMLAELQDNFSLLNAFGAIVGNFTIISGCAPIGIEGTSITDGTVYINGELLEFKGGVVQGNVRIVEVIEALEFEDLTTKDVIFRRHVRFGTATTNTFLWSDFRRGLETKSIADLIAAKADTAALVAITNAITTITTKLSGIEANAQKNVQANWTQNDNTKDDFIKNKPGIIAYLHQGVHNVGDVLATDILQTVNFPTVGSNNYMVIGTMVSEGGDFNNDNDVIFSIRDKQNASFKLALREVGARLQALKFEYILIPLL